MLEQLKYAYVFYVILGNRNEYFQPWRYFPRSSSSCSGFSLEVFLSGTVWKKIVLVGANGSLRNRRFCVTDLQRVPEDQARKLIRGFSGH